MPDLSQLLDIGPARQVKTAGKEDEGGLPSATNKSPARGILHAYNRREKHAQFILHRLHGLNPKTKLYFSIGRSNWRGSEAHEIKNLRTICGFCHFLFVKMSIWQHSWHVQLRSLNRTKPSNNRPWSSTALVSRDHAHIALAAACEDPYLILPLLCPESAVWEVTFPNKSTQVMNGRQIAKLFKHPIQRSHRVTGVMLNQRWEKLDAPTIPFEFTFQGMESAFRAKRRAGARKALANSPIENISTDADHLTF